MSAETYGLKRAGSGDPRTAVAGREGVRLVQVSCLAVDAYPAPAENRDLAVDA